MDYETIEKKILDVLEKTLFCTLATANRSNVVSASQVCLINDGLSLYVQTDKNFEKAENIRQNENVAINLGPMYFKGKAKIIGKACDNKNFVEKIKKKHIKTYEHYTNLENEILIKIDLTECKLWGSDPKKDIHNQESVLVVDLVNKTFKEVICDKM